MRHIWVAATERVRFSELTLVENTCNQLRDVVLLPGDVFNRTNQESEVHLPNAAIGPTLAGFAPELFLLGGLTHHVQLVERGNIFGAVSSVG